MKTSEDLIAAAVREKLSACMADFAVLLRDTYDGAGMDVMADFTVSWRRQAAKGPQMCWGTHRGCIRGTHDNLKASLFWGHYDLTEDEAKDDFRARTSRLG
tara:strand:- start:288 stop:590 length:303 start_codon:yes stop_codon:yes gene_type:complete